MDKYNEALKKAKKLYEQGTITESLAYIFPELKESEGEYVEKIKKDIISYLNNRKIETIPESSATEKWIDWLKKQKPIINKEDEEVRQYLIRTMKQNDINVPMVQKALAWLEKQGEKESNKMHIWKHWKDGICGNGEGKLIYLIKDGNDYNLSSCLGFECDYIELSELDKLLSEKQGGQRDSDVKDYNSIDPYFLKPTNKIEPKFHEGEWVVQGDNILKIRCVGDTYYCFETVGVYVDDMLISEIDSQFHLWTIQDAKPGDVLVCNEEILLFKSYSVQGRISLYCWYNGQTNNFHSKEMNDISLSTRNKIYPATKEQRDTLFAKMHEAGCQLPTS